MKGVEIAEAESPQSRKSGNKKASALDRKNPPFPQKARKGWGTLKHNESRCGVDGMERDGSSGPAATTTKNLRTGQECLRPRADKETCDANREICVPRKARGTGTEFLRPWVVIIR